MRHIVVYLLLMMFMMLAFEVGRFVGFAESITTYEAFLHD